MGMGENEGPAFRFKNDKTQHRMDQWKNQISLSLTKVVTYHEYTITFLT